MKLELKNVVKRNPMMRRLCVVQCHLSLHCSLKWHIMEGSYSLVEIKRSKKLKSLNLKSWKASKSVWERIEELERPHGARTVRA